MPLMFWQAKPLIVDGKLAMHERCCCGSATRCVYYWHVIWDCDAQAWGPVFEGAAMCTDTTGMTENVWQFEFYTPGDPPFPDICQYILAKFGPACTDHADCTNRPAAPAAPSFTPTDCPCGQ